jgi:superfamily II DNA or RNA helicase
LKTNIQYTLTKKEWETLSKSYEREYPEGFLERVANDNRRNAIILLRLIELSKESKHILVFGASKKQSKLLCGLLIALNYSAVHVDGNTPSTYRKDVVEKFKEGKIQFIFNYGVFTTGFDSPNIDAVVIARPTTSIVLYGQMIGRGMRGFEINGTKEFKLIDVVDEIITEYSGLDNVYEFFSEYWESD